MPAPCRHTLRWPLGITVPFLRPGDEASQERAREAHTCGVDSRPPGMCSEGEAAEGWQGPGAGVGGPGQHLRHLSFCSQTALAGGRDICPGRPGLDAVQGLRPCPATPSEKWDPLCPPRLSGHSMWPLALQPHKRCGPQLYRHDEGVLPPGTPPPAALGPPCRPRPDPQTPVCGTFFLRSLNYLKCH